VSFPIGARLHNGLVASVNDSGVRFVVNGNPRTSVTRGWGRPATKAKSEKED